MFLILLSRLKEIMLILINLYDSRISYIFEWFDFFKYLYLLLCPPSSTNQKAAGTTCHLSFASIHFFHRSKKGKKGRKRANRAAVHTFKTEPENPPTEDQQSWHPPLPIVGTWEFELEDEEYLRFLDLMLSYMLGKDGADGREYGGELPLLRSYSSQLRKGELHSLAFDALTSVQLRLRERKDREPPPVFRAGCCYKPVQEGALESHTSSAWNEDLASIISLSKGLFALRQQQQQQQQRKGSAGHKVIVGADSSTLGGSSGTAPPPKSSSVLGSFTTVEPSMDLQQGLDPQLESHFPKLGRLLEWMVRWADRRAPLRLQRKSRSEKVAADQGSVVMRVKASTPAILASLSILRHRSDSLLGEDRHVAHMQVPEMQWTVAPVLQPVEVDGRLQGDTGLEEAGSPESACAPLTGLDEEERTV